jgi:ABC-2 type transport system ATP-binding protein
MTKAIVVDNVTKRFGAKTALGGVSFSVDAGAIFGFLGPNGAGKTTTIRCLMDLVRPDTGSVTVAGLDSRRDAVEIKRQVGYLPADAPLYSNWTGQEHIDFVAGLRGTQPDQELIKELDFDPRPRARQLSTGNQQKLSIILALTGKPRLLVLDEPTRGLDPLMQNQLYDILKRFREGGGTVLMSSHNLSEVEKICDSVTVIRAGRVVMEQALDRLKEHSIYHVTATFEHKVDPKRFKVGGIQVMTHDANTLTLRVKGDINPLMHLLVHSPLKDLEVNRASLEEIFLELYQ